MLGDCHNWARPDKGVATQKLNKLKLNSSGLFMDVESMEAWCHPLDLVLNLATVFRLLVKTASFFDALSTRTLSASLSNLQFTLGPV